MLNKKYKIKDTIDIYITETNKSEYITITFHIMTTRDRLEISTNKKVAEFLALLDGIKTNKEIIEYLGGGEDLIQLENLIKFLLEQHLIYDFDEKIEINPRYKRQINFFDDLILDRSGTDSQLLLESKTILFLGCGAVNAAIAENLVRCGVRSLILLDYKNVIASNFDRHNFFKKKYIGETKVEALSLYLNEIKSDLNIKKINCKLNYNSDLSEIIPKDVDLVINGCDEPYIGHTSLKIGRYLQGLNIPLYVSGGFDAHLMSSGELIYPPFTPCVDCVQKTFVKALSSWKPIYSESNNIELIVNDCSNANVESNKNDNFNIGGAGGLAMQSCFSANFSCLSILQLLLEDSAFNYSPIRYEYLINNGYLTEFDLEKQGGCNVCNR